MTRSEAWLRVIQQLKIRRRDRKIRPLTLNGPQQIVYNRIAPKLDAGEPIWMILLKARREGMSTLIESLLFTFCATADNVNALVTAHISTASKRIWNMSKLFRDASPWLSASTKVGNNQIMFGGSVLEITTAGSPEATRSADLTAFHGSEVAFWPHPEALLATLQTVPHNKDILTIVALESTANGMVEEGKLFYDEWKRAEEGESDFIPIFLPWFHFEDYHLPNLTIEEPDPEEIELRGRFDVSDPQLAWRRWAIANLCQGDIDKFHQEYPSTSDEAFIQSGLPFFRSEHLHWLEEYVDSGERVIVDPDGTVHPDRKGWLEIFKFPEAGHQYVVGSDSSMGLDTDTEKDQSATRSRSAACVIDMDTMEQVAEYDASTPPHIQAAHLAGIGRLYNNALLAPEVQSSGGGGGREIIVYLREQYEYWQIHQWQGHPDKIRRSPAHLYGWETNARTRPRMLARIREVVLERSAVIHSRKLLTQLRSFGENDAGRLEALAGHDDLLFAWGIALMSRTENYFKMPASGTGPQHPDYRSLGLRVIAPEHPMDRLKRILQLTDPQAPKSFMEI